MYIHIYIYVYIRMRMCVFASVCACVIAHKEDVCVCNHTNHIHTTYMQKEP